MIAVAGQPADDEKESFISPMTWTLHFAKQFRDMAQLLECTR